jgi:GxxExxY protein
MTEEENRMASPALVPTPRVNRVSGIVVNAAMRVHSLLGPGLLESAYQACLAQELRIRGLKVATQLRLPVVYDGEKLDLGYRIDLLVENLVIVEIKSVDAIHPVHEAQFAVISAIERKKRRVTYQFSCCSFEGWYTADGRRQGLGEVGIYRYCWEKQCLYHGGHRGVTPLRSHITH